MWKLWKTSFFLEIMGKTTEGQPCGKAKDNYPAYKHFPQGPIFPTIYPQPVPRNFTAPWGQTYPQVTTAFLPFFDFFFQFHDGIFQCFVIFHLLFDFGNAMDDGGMVSAAEAFADFGQGNV